LNAVITKPATYLVNNAPAVQYPVGRSSFQGCFLLMSCIGGLLVGGLWIGASAAIGGAQVLFFVVLAGVLTLAGHRWHQTDSGLLAWGGERWDWTTGGQSIRGCVVVHFDVQLFMIVTLQDDQGRSVWLWLDRASDTLRWRALRRALYADKEILSAAGRGQERVSAEDSV
jgi:hypothetical protein